MLSLAIKKTFISGLPKQLLKCSAGKLYLSDSVTYSGGQATSGQGGYYGSGGSRKLPPPTHHPEAIARQADILAIVQLMTEIENLEMELRTLGNVVNTRSIEIKARIKKTISNPNVRELLNRLEIKGEPVWGLSAKEREIVKLARQKYEAS